jgi:hypothetical protein
MVFSRKEMGRKLLLLLTAYGFVAGDSGTTIPKKKNTTHKITNTIKNL